jgi:hypothetical protein
MKMTAFWDIHCVVSYKKTDVSEVRTSSIIREKKMEETGLSETSVYFYETTHCYIAVVHLQLSNKFLNI